MNALPRRALLTGLGTVALGGVIGASPALQGPAAAAPSLVDAAAPGSGHVVRGYPNPGLDTGHATPQLARLIIPYFQDKTARDVDKLLTHFSRERLSYTDATVGASFRSWAQLRGFYESVLPSAGPDAISYPTRVIGDEHSAMILFTDSPQYFGGEVIIIAPVDFHHGKITREADYRDGRHFGQDRIGALRTPIAQWPVDYGENPRHEQTAPTLRRVIAALHATFTDNAAASAAALFTSDAVFEDLTLHLRLAGQQAIGGFLQRALPSLPYGSGTQVRHTVGGRMGGGYEWVNRAAKNDQPQVWQGVIALELDARAKISRLTAVWDGALMDHDTLTALLATTIER